MSSSLAPSPTCKRQCFQSSAKAVTAETQTAPGILHAHLELRQGLASPHLHGVCQRLRQREPVQRCRGKTNILLLAVGFCTTRLLHATSKLQSLRDRLSLSVLEDGSRKAGETRKFSGQIKFDGTKISVLGLPSQYSAFQVLASDANSDNLSRNDCNRPTKGRGTWNLAFSV